MQIITSRQNQLYKYLKKQIAQQHNDEKQALAIINHPHLLQELWQNWQQHTCKFLLPGYLILSADYVSEKINQDLQQLFAALCPTVIVEAQLFNQLQTIQTPAKAIVICQVLPAANIDYQANTVLLERLQDPGNLGTILRSCLATGYRQIILSPNSAAVWSEKVLRSAQGAHFQLNLISDYLINDFIDKFTGLVLATTPQAEKSLFSLQTQLKNKHAWLFGTEGNGISDDLLSKIAHKISIPMSNNCQSLNVASAATLCLYQRLRH